MLIKYGVNPVFNSFLISQFDFVLIKPSFRIDEYYLENNSFKNKLKHIRG